MGITHFEKISGEEGIYTGSKDNESVLTTGVLNASTSWTPGSLAPGDTATKDVTVSGASLGDFALSSFSLDLQDLIINSAVTGANTVTVSLSNQVSGTVSLGAGTLKVKVLK